MTQNSVSRTTSGRTYRLLSWNVNGLRAVLKKDFLKWFLKESPDALCLQEIKATQAQLPPDVLYLPGYHLSIHSAEKPGYSGVATFTKDKPVKVNTGFGMKDANSPYFFARTFTAVL